MTLSRRTLLAGAAALPALVKAEQDPQVPRRRLGKTGREVPILLMGGSMRFDPRFDPKLAECLRYGVACGAESMQHFGAGLLDPSAVDRLLPEVELEHLETGAEIR